MDDHATKPHICDERGMAQEYGLVSSRRTAIKEPLLLLGNFNMVFLMLCRDIYDFSLDKPTLPFGTPHLECWLQHLFVLFANHFAIILRLVSGRATTCNWYV